jgi:hypothetical protein
MAASITLREASGRWTAEDEMSLLAFDCDTAEEAEESVRQIIDPQEAKVV